MTSMAACNNLKELFFISVVRIFTELKEMAIVYMPANTKLNEEMSFSNVWRDHYLGVLFFFWP